jgi:feruloyl esterase
LRTEFPKNAFGNAVRTAAQLAANEAGIAVIRLTLSGFDTHQNQPGVENFAFALNQESLVNFAYASYKKTHDVAIALGERYYGKRPMKSYYLGDATAIEAAMQAVARQGKSS